MGADSDALEPLPALKLCNSSPPYNPLQGEGALGNQYRGQMHYKGSDRITLVETLQSMLVSLGYDVGPTGVDGKFGDNTEKAVRSFQEENKDWEGTPLQVDGLVGPKTADALNRSMVGAWYDHYQTPTELTDEKPCHAATSDFLTSGLSIEVKETTDARVFLVDQTAGGAISEVKWEKPEVIAFDATAEEAMKVKTLVKTAAIDDDAKANLEVFQFQKADDSTLYKSVTDLHIKNNELVGADDAPYECHFEWHDTIYEYKRTQYWFKVKVGTLVKAVEQKKDTMIRLKEFDGIIANPDDSLPGATTEGTWVEEYLKKEGPWMEATEGTLKKDGHEVMKHHGKSSAVSVSKCSELLERNKFLHHQASHGYAYCYDHGARGLTLSTKVGVKKSGTVGADGVEDWWCPECKNLDDVVGVICLKSFPDDNFEKDAVDQLERSPKTLVIANCCLTAITETFPKAFLDKGTRWYIGWAVPVGDSNCVNFAKAFYKRWCEHYKMNPDKVGKAFDDVHAPYAADRPRIFGK